MQENVVGKTETEIKAEKVVENAKNGEHGTPKATSESKPTSGSESKENTEKMETKKSEKAVAVDKELLQARVEIFLVVSFCLCFHLALFFSPLCSVVRLIWSPFSRLSGFLTGIELDTSG